MNVTFMESVWWAFKQLFEKGMVYQSYKVMPYSTALNTPVSNFEAAQNYKDVQDPAVVVAFPLLDDPETSLLAWTTTPWTLPSHTSLAAHPDLEYIKLRDDAQNRNFVLMEPLLHTLYKDPKKAKVKILERFKGSHMKGWKYEPPFRYFYDKFKDHGFRVINATYVTADSGVGIVHQAPAFGAEDYTVAWSEGVISPDRLPPNPVDEYGCFTSEVVDFAGQYVKDADKAIIKNLKERGRMIVASTTTHSYPFCYRSDTPLLYKAIPSWFVRVQPIIPKMLENIKDSHWVPSVIKERRFANWIASSPDWAVSRNRFWGTPIPLWVNEDLSEIVAIGSAQELKDLSGYKGELTDLHRDKIDDITIPSKSGGKPLRRVSEVFDCWFESGSMPYASAHYPFENKEFFEKSFPANFIAEGIDQTRGWFYTLLVLGTHLFGVAPFQHNIINGTILASDGKKMSKRLKNYPDPVLVIEHYGSDALRLYMINSPVVRAENLRFREAGVKEIVAKVLLPLWNSYRFFADQVLLLKKLENIDFMFDPSIGPHNENVMDRWILASCQSLLKYIDQEMAAYRLYTVVPTLLGLVDGLTNWYIRFNRKRLKGEYGIDDTTHALNTLFETLYTLVRALAPFTPFLTETIYQLLVKHIPKSLHGVDMRSVHFQPFPKPREELFDEVIERRVGRMQRVIELGRVSRERKAIGLKQPLKSLVVLHPSQQYLDDVRSLETEITEELNVNELILTSDEDKYNVQYILSADWPTLGKKLKKDAQKVKKALPNVTNNEAKAFLQSKHITVDGIELTEEDLVVRRGLAESASGSQWESNTDNDVLTLLNIEIDETLAKAGIARQIINRVQQLRKRAKLVPTDEVKMEYKVLSDPEKIGLDEVFATHGKDFEKTLRRNFDKHVVTEAGGEIPKDKKEEVIAEEEQELQQATFLLRLVKL
jgi:isoleucyl-tRNA synthetase